MRKRRFNSGTRQFEAAQLLDVSELTLSLWERDKVYPTWAYHPRLIAYLGYDPFTNPALGSPGSNETQSVAFLAQNGPLPFGQQIKKRRIELKKTRKECAKEIGISVKTLWGWEASHRQPTAILRKRAMEFFGFEPAPAKQHSGS